MSLQLVQPWQQYLAQMGPKEVEFDTECDYPISSEQVGMCPGSVECSLKPHALGTTSACAKETKIGVVFLNSSG